jgi:hypothetical protein
MGLSPDAQSAQMLGGLAAARGSCGVWERSKRRASVRANESVDALGLRVASEEFPDDFHIGLWHIVLLFISGSIKPPLFSSLISFHSLSSQRT